MKTIALFTFSMITIAFLSINLIQTRHILNASVEIPYEEIEIVFVSDK
jgi:hypothetical protein